MSTPFDGEGDDEAEGVGVAVEPDPVLDVRVEVEDEPDVPDVEAVLDPAASRAAWAATSWACATVTARSRSAVPIVASTSPASTSSPTPTLTEVTVPAVRNAAVTWSTRSTDPASEIVWVTDPVDTVAVRRPAVAAWLGTASTTR